MKWIISNLKEKIVDDSYRKKMKKINSSKVKMVVCPCDKQLSYFQEGNYLLGSQDVNYAYDVQELKRMNVKYTIVGHSDKRKKYSETNEEINKKIKELLNNNICPILCIGEEKEEDDIEECLKQQLVTALLGIKTTSIMIAYEPVWAIASGKIPSKNQLLKALEYINEIAIELLGVKPTLLYGGSVNEKTISFLEEIKLLEGYLIGSTSLDIDRLNSVIEVVE